MDAGNVNATTKPHKILAPRKNFNSRPLKAESVPEKLFNDDEDTMQKCIRYSENIKSEDVSGEYEQMAKSNATSRWIRSQPAMDMADCRRADTGRRYLVEKPTPLAPNPNALVGEDDIYEPVVRHEQEPMKRRRSNSENPVPGSRICEQESYADLEAKVKELKYENSISHRDMMEISESCAQLKRENYRLLKKLKKMCSPDTIAFLEARNPDKNVTTRIT